MASNRLFRAGLADSEAVAGLSDFAFRVYSLLVLASDDAGRLDGRPNALRADIFPVGRHAECRTQQLEKTLAEIREARLIVCYEFQSKPYIQITKVHRYGSSECSRFPWIDGEFRIMFVKRATRDGDRLFVSTSLLDLKPTEVPFIPPKQGVQRGYERQATGTGTGTDTKTDTGTTGRRSAAQKMKERLLNADAKA